jgi:hypothetical protein
MLLKRISPLWLTFVGSLLLSLIAIAGTDILARDAAFYMDIAHQVNVQGPRVALVMFDWPWFAMLIAGTHALTRLPLELCAHLYCALFMAGACTLMVDCIRQRAPQATWWGCLVVLAMPAINQFRWDIIREDGFWFFCILALWLALRWESRGGWLRAAAIYVAVGAAALFRLEALTVLVALGAWQLPNLFIKGRRRTFLEFFWLPLVLLIPVLLVVIPRIDWHSSRVAYMLALIEPRSVFANFNKLANQFGTSLINKYSVDEAGRIIFFGLLASLLIKFVNLMGPFALPFLWPRAWRGWQFYWQAFRPFACVGGAYFVVMMLFFINAQFMIGRYLSFLDVMVIPLLAVALSQFAQAWPRLAKALLALGLLVMLANVISLGGKKTNFIASGQWVAAHIDANAPVFYEDGRISYYAGRGYPQPTIPREIATAPGNAERYQYFVFEADQSEPWLQAWIAEHRLQVLAHFAQRKGKTVTVVGP